MSCRVVTTFKFDKSTPPYIEAIHVLSLVSPRKLALPESNFLSQMCEEALEQMALGNPKAPIRVPRTLRWAGNYAGIALEEVAPYIVGRLECYFTADGEPDGGAIIENGVYTRCSVETTLVPIT